ncbi:spore photoproduct lyase family protein [Chloroflexota bacterium]
MHRLNLPQRGTQCILAGAIAWSHEQGAEALAVTHTLSANQSPPRWVGRTSAGRSILWFVEEQVANGTWREETIPAEVVGLSRPLVVCRAPRKTNLITHSWHGGEDTFCPPVWWDLAIGSGPCGLGCRACFLMLTHRIKRDPLRHLLYDNLTDFVLTTERWLRDPERRRQHTLGIGIDRSDSLLYEGVVEHVRSLAPLFGDSDINRNGNKLILLTKSSNAHYLAEISPKHRSHVVVSFSLNPEPIADRWEGKWPDTGERITPPISERVKAAKYAQQLGFEVRVRLDPILTPEGWREQYSAFVAGVRGQGINFHSWTLGTYREKNTQLDDWRQRWGLPAMEWQPEEDELIKDGTHWHLSLKQRVMIYRSMRDIIRGEFPQAKVSLCKESHAVRKRLNLCNADCNCLR